MEFFDFPKTNKQSETKAKWWNWAHGGGWF